MKKIIFIIICFISFIPNAFGLEINSKNALLYNLTDDIYLLDKNGEVKTPIASITKIMTALVAIDYIEDLDNKIIIKEDDFNGLIEQNASLAGFEIGQTVTYRDLLYGLMLPSGADAALALVHNTYLTEENYINKMNELSSKIGLNDTNFNSTTGLDVNNNYSTLKDLVKLLKYAIKNQTFYTIFTSNKYTTSDFKLDFISSLSRNIKKYNLDLNYIVGSKTGTTDDAGLCLISLAKYNNTEYILVTTQAPKDYNTPYHFLDAQTIYKYYFNNFGYINVLGGETINVDVKDSLEKEIQIVLSDTTIYMDKNLHLDRINYKYNVNDVSYKNEIGEKIGSLDIYYEDDYIKTIDLILNVKIHYNYYKFLIVIVLIIFRKLLLNVL